jgi:hypothetical protein
MPPKFRTLKHTLKKCFQKQHPKFRTSSPHPHLVCLHDATEIPRPKPEKISHAVGDIAARAQRRKPESCTVCTLWFPLAAIPENDRQRNSREEGANYTGLRRHPLAGVAPAPWAPPTVGHISVARLPAAGTPANIRGIS